MAKRYRHALWPNLNVGGIYQFVDGYFPPLGKPPTTDEGIIHVIESMREFGTHLYEVDPNLTLTIPKPSPPSEEVPNPKTLLTPEEQRAELIAQAERYAVANLPDTPAYGAARVPKPAVRPDPEPKPAPPSKDEIRDSKKVQLLAWIEKFELPIDPNGKNVPQLRKLVREALEVVYAGGA